MGSISTVHELSSRESVEPGFQPGVTGCVGERKCYLCAIRLPRIYLLNSLSLKSKFRKFYSFKIFEQSDLFQDGRFGVNKTRHDLLVAHRCSNELCLMPESLPILYSVLIEPVSCKAAWQFYD